MRDLFNMDNPLMRGLSRIFDLIVLNFLTLLCCIPIITAGAAFAAMHQMLIRMVEDRDSYLIKPYFVCFKENFLKATLIWLVMLFAGVLFFIDYRIINVMEGDQKKWIGLALLAVSLFLLMIAQYLFPLQAHYVNPVRTTFSNALKVSIAFFPRTLGMLLAQVLLAVAFYKFWDKVLPLYLMLGFAGVGYIKAKLYVPIFHKLDPGSGDAGNEEIEQKDNAAELEQKILERQIPGR